jgi:enoyl-CoA hydratase/carnithine racemase
MADYIYIKTQKKDHVFTLTLARSEKRNAFTPTMVNEIHHALAKANIDKEIWLVLINAEGPVFCSGMDLKVFQNPELDQENPEIENLNISLNDAIGQLNKPSIAVVEGDVMAGGMLLTLNTTYVYAKPDVEFSLPEVKRGIFPFQVMGALLNFISIKKTLDLCITGKVLDSKEAIGFGLVSGVLAADFEFNKMNDEGLNTLISVILSNSPSAIRAGMLTAKELKQVYETEKNSYLLSQLEALRSTKDAQEGAKAFFEKRAPSWTNE